jgi:hypothetical protein
MEDDPKFFPRVPAGHFVAALTPAGQSLPRGHMILFGITMKWTKIALTCRNAWITKGQIKRFPLQIQASRFVENKRIIHSIFVRPCTKT